MNILNIDQLVTTTRQIKVGGVFHAVQDQSVQQFIDAIRAADELEKQAAEGRVTPVGSLEQAIKSVCQAVPTLPESSVRAMSMPVLTAVLNFIRGEDPVVADNIAAAVDGQPAHGEKKPL